MLLAFARSPSAKHRAVDVMPKRCSNAKPRSATNLKSLALILAVCAHCDDAAEAHRVWARCPLYVLRDTVVDGAMARSGALCSAHAKHTNDRSPFKKSAHNSLINSNNSPIDALRAPSAA
jgi:hypothetical protein